jgi:hypothetical protein
MADYDFSSVDAIDSATPSPSPSVPQSLAQSPQQGGYDFSSVDAINKYGSPSQQALTAIEQGVSGATLGLSKKLETSTGLTTPEAIAGRESANPVTATLANIGGTGALLTATGGLGAIGEAGSVAGRIGVGALEGAGIGGINQATDDWSQNKALDAQKILASAGIGAIFGGAGAGLIEGIKAYKGGAPTAESIQSANNSNSDVPPPDGFGPSVVDPAPVKGVQPTSYQDLIDRTQNAKYMGNAVQMPQKAVLEDALSRIEMNNPVHPLQLDSLDNQGARDTYNTAKETPGEIGDALRANEALQKGELVNKTDQAIQNISPGSEPNPDAVQGGKTAVDAFTDQYQNEQAQLKPIFEELKRAPIIGDPVTDLIGRMSDAVPGVSEMFDITGGDIGIKPYKTAWGIDKATYNAVKEATQSLLDDPNDFKSIWNIRKGLDQHIDVLAQGQAPSEIRALKAAMMDYMQDSVQNNPDVNVRDTFRRYAINEQQRNVIEKTFGASVGKPEFGAISKVKPEQIGDKIFSNTANVSAAKQILPREQFNTILANWIAEAKAAATDKGAFSSNKFGSFLKRNQDALNVAFSDNPEQLQRLQDMTNIMRILPDAPPVNPSGTAKTLFRMVQNAKVHDMTWEGLLASIPQTLLKKAAAISERADLNHALAGKAANNSATQQLMKHVGITSDKIDAAIKGLFGGASANARKFK